MSDYRVLHVPKNVGGNPEGLNRHLKILGVNSTSLVFEQKFYDHPTDKVLWDKSDSIFKNELKRLAILLDAVKNYDVIHFNFGRTLSFPPSIKRLEQSNGRFTRNLYSPTKAYMVASQWIELSLFKLFKKQLFIHYQGSDARPLVYTVDNFEKNLKELVNEQKNIAAEQKAKLKRIKKLGSYCTKIYSVNPDLLHILPKGSQFIPYCHISLDEWKPVNKPGLLNRPLIVGHAPTSRELKGTQYILDAVKELKAEGYAIELELTEGVRHSEVREKYEKVDVFIDQLLIGWYGGVAVEAMALGKPVLVYIREGDMKFIPDKMIEDFPFVQVTPNTVKEGIRKVLKMSESELQTLGEKSRAFVEAWHDPLKIAQQIKNDYEQALNGND